MNPQPNFEKAGGSGIPLVFIHGWLGSIQSWEQVREHLELSNPIVFYDQRCHGESRCSPFRFRDLAEDLEKLLEELEIEDPVFVGHSMGGMTALKYASLCDNLSGLVLLATSASTPEPEIEDFDYYLEKLGNDREKWAEKISENYSSEDQLKRRALKELVDADEEPLRYPLEAMQDYDVTGEIGNIEVPAKVVAGEKDGSITVEQCREVSELIGCELQVIDSGHLMPWETPDKIAEIIENFIDQIRFSNDTS